MLRFMKSKKLSLLLLTTLFLGAQTKISAPTQTKDLANNGVYWYSANLSFGGIPAFSCREANFELPTATPGYLLIQGWPAFLPLQVSGMMYSGNSIVVVRLCNLSDTLITIPNGLNYSVGVIKQ